MKINNDEIKTIIPLTLPYSPDDKIFYNNDEESGETIGEPYSYNDWIQKIKNISGVNEELMGKNAHK